MGWSPGITELFAHRDICVQLKTQHSARYQTKQWPSARGSNGREVKWRVLLTVCASSRPQNGMLTHLGIRI